MAESYEKTIQIVRKPSGKVYYYAWKGGPALKDCGAPGSAEFKLAWERAMALRADPDNTLKGLIEAWRKSPKYTGAAGRKSYADRTRSNYEFWMKRIEAHFGALPLSAFNKRESRKDILEWRDKWLYSPRQADAAIQAISVLLSFGVETDKLDANHALGIPKVYEADRSDMIWRAQDLAILKQAASPEVWQVAILASLTGLRQSDVLKLQWDQVGETKMHVATRKSRRRTTAVVIRYPELDDFLATLERRADTVVVNVGGKSYKSGFGSSWTATMDRGAKLIKDPAHLDYWNRLHFHDLRGNAATRLFAAGLSEAQIARFLGWKESAVKALLDRYVSLDEAADLISAQIQRTKRDAEFSGFSENGGKLQGSPNAET